MAGFIDAIGPVVGGLFMLLFMLVELAIVLLFIGVLWRLYQALGIYIREHEFEDDTGSEKSDGVGESS